VEVASAGPYASLYLAPDRQPHQHPTTQFLQALPATQPTASKRSRQWVTLKIMCLSLFPKTVFKLKPPMFIFSLLCSYCSY